MSSPLTHIHGGKLYDPVQQCDGSPCDLWLQDGQVIAPPGDPQLRASAKQIDATGCVIMPGGVEMHSHIASLAVNTARRLQSAAGYHDVVPTAPVTSALYAALGYTTAIEPAVPPGGAELAHLQLDTMTQLDTGLLLLVGNHEGVITHLRQRDRPAALALLRQLIQQHRAYGLKAVNPAAVALWRREPTLHHVDDIDQTVPDTGLSPRAMLELLTEAQEELCLPHPIHIHGPCLGEPGNVDITATMLRALAGRRCHLAHLQYYCYGKNRRGSFRTSVEPLLEHLRDHREVTADLGLVAFGPAFTATADLPLEHALYRAVGKPSTPAVFHESGNEDCFGLMPLVHSPRSASHSLQWATGLELALKADDLWQFALTIDHPNGGSFLNYPLLIAQLMSKPRRDEQLAQAHKAARTECDLGNIGREMTLYDIAILTRAAPAKALGLQQRKGHLGVGADADVTIYRDEPGDPQAMFTRPRLVLKGGIAVVKDGELVQDQRCPAPTRLTHAV